MSSPMRMTATAVATLWRTESEDEFGQSSFSEPVLLNVNIDVGLKQKYSAKGIENSPNNVMWMEVIDDNPKKGDHIAKGDFLSELNPLLVDASEIITATEIQDCSLLGEIDDLMLET